MCEVTLLPEDLLVLWAVGDRNNAPGVAAKAPDFVTEEYARGRLEVLADEGFLEEYVVGGVYKPVSDDAAGRLRDRLNGQAGISEYL